METTQTTPTPVPTCKCPTVNEADWDKKKKILNKTFYKTFSPRLLFIPFSYAIDLDRASRAALKKGYQIPVNPMVLSSDGMFWGSLMVEVTGAQTGDSNVVNLNQEVYTKVSKRDWKLLKLDIAELTQELGGQPPKEVYCWYTSCPKCKDSKVVKTVLIAVPQPPAIAQPTPSATPQPTAQPTPPSVPAAVPPQSSTQPQSQPPTTPQA